ncbi:MAG: hypothetical protein IMZ53_06090 [Thermoplasmata archaeon]|nr:hypothetical protein [Thermoplasmata archaeon]
MPQITNAGTYRGRIIEHVVNVSSGGFPQFVPRLVADEMYDRDNKEWVGLSDTPDIVGYLVLVDGKDNKTMNCSQIEKVTGWDGIDLLALETADLVDKPVLFVVKEHTYNDKISMQVDWVDEFDADPIRGLKKLDPDKLKALQSKFGKSLGGKTAKPVSAASGKNKTAAAPIQAPKKTTVPSMPTRKPTEPKVKIDAGKCTKEEAFAYVSNTELWKKDVTNETLSGAWVDTVNSIAGERPDSEITPEEWYKVQQAVAQKVFVF